MGESELPPSLEDMADSDENYWMEDTTITVSRYTKARLDHHRDGRPWDQFLEMLRREHADPLTFNDANEIAEYLADHLTEETTNAD